MGIFTIKYNWAKFNWKPRRYPIGLFISLAMLVAYKAYAVSKEAVPDDILGGSYAILSFYLVALSILMLAYFVTPMLPFLVTRIVSHFLLIICIVFFAADSLLIICLDSRLNLSETEVYLPELRKIWTFSLYGGGCSLFVQWLSVFFVQNWVREGQQWLVPSRFAFFHFDSFSHLRFHCGKLRRNTRYNRTLSSSMILYLPSPGFKAWPI